MVYFLELGSNLGDKRRNLERALRRLEEAGLTILEASSVYRTEPVDVTGQPWFLNRVLKVKTGLGPQELLSLAKSIEHAMKRIPAARRGPRTIDIDILLAGRTVLDSPALSIPHPRLALRNFVLVPLAEIAPRGVHPVLHRTVRELVRRSPDKSRVVRADGRGGRKSGRGGPRRGRRPRAV